MKNQMFGWVIDLFGMSWQLSLTERNQYSSYLLQAN